jgi:sulfur carrier protein
MPLSFALMVVIVNGESIELPAGATVADLVQRTPRAGGACAVEINQRVIPHREHGTRALHEGDRVELVTLVGGG